MLKKYLSQFAIPFLTDPNGGGAGAGAGAGSGGSGSGAGAGGSAAAAPSAIVLNGDSMVDFGDGKPIKWSEASDPDRGRYVTRDRYDRGVQFLQTEAQKLQAAWDKYHEGTGRRPAQAEPAAQGRDPLEGIRDLPIVDGRTIAQLYDTLQKQGFGPMAQVVSAMANRLKQLEGNMQGVGKSVGTLTEREQTQEFESYITKAFSEAGPIKGLPDGVTIDANEPHLREKAKDLYLSHDPNSWKPGEFAKQLNARLAADIAFVRALDKKAVEAAQGKKRVWLNPNRGQGNPSGNTPYQHKRGADIARSFFDGSVAQGT